MRPVVLVTGASGGIGADLARVFAEHGHDVALLARSQQRLEALADELATPGRARPLVVAADLADPEAVERIAEALAAQGARVSILVNNAGFGLLGAVAELDAAAQLGVVDVNIRALVALTLRFLPDMAATGGRVLNVGSVASFMPGPGMAVYYASKHFVSAVSRAVGGELAGSGVVVSLLHPGVTRTGFQARAGFTAANSAVAGGMDARRVAEAGYAGLMAGRRVIVPGFGNKLAALLVPALPDRLLLPLVHRFQRKRSHARRTHARS